MSLRSICTCPLCSFVLGILQARIPESVARGLLQRIIPTQGRNLGLFRLTCTGRSKCLLISWLQSRSSVILEQK
ncbi:hypothetical protein CapIbe_005387 [Capra ibex]